MNPSDEYRLLIAVLRQGVTDLHGTPHREIAYHWFHDEVRHHICSFFPLCEGLEIDPVRIRNQALKGKWKETP